MSSYLFAKPDNLNIDLKALPSALYSNDSDSLMHQLSDENDGYGHEEVLDKDKPITTGDFIKYFTAVKKMYGYFCPEYLDSWKLFLNAILEQNPSASVIEFHFVYEWDNDSRPFYFRSVRLGPSSIKFATFVGEGNSPWCFSVQPALKSDNDSDEEEEEEDETNADDEVQNCADVGKIDESKDDLSVDVVGIKRKTLCDSASSALPTKKVAVQKEPRMVNRFDLEKYKANYATHIEEYRMDPKAASMLRMLNLLGRY